MVCRWSVKAWIRLVSPLCKLSSFLTSHTTGMLHGLQKMNNFSLSWTFYLSAMFQSEVETQCAVIMELEVHTIILNVSAEYSMNLMWVHNALVFPWRVQSFARIEYQSCCHQSGIIQHSALLVAFLYFFFFPLCNCTKQSNLLYKLDILVVDVSERVHRCCLEKQSHLRIDVQCKCLPILACNSHVSFHTFTCLSNLLYGVFSTTSQDLLHDCYTPFWCIEVLQTWWWQHHKPLQLYLLIL